MKAPLQLLNIGSCRLNVVPNLGILPQLVVMNISNNPLREVTAQQFSGFCSLTSIEIQNATEMPPCMCKAINIYFRNRTITMKNGLDCSTESEGMPNHSTLHTNEFISFYRLFRRNLLRRYGKHNDRQSIVRWMFTGSRKSKIIWKIKANVGDDSSGFGRIFQHFHRHSLFFSSKKYQTEKSGNQNDQSETSIGAWNGWCTFGENMIASWRVSVSCVYSLK